jgi:hypothetical protein
MNIRIIASLVTVLALSLLGCGGGAKPAASAPSAKCPAAGTSVDFGKAMNPTFAADYEGCSIKTSVLMWSANSLMSSSLGDSESVVFEVSDPAVGEGSYQFVKIAKASSDLVFAVKKGDPLVLTGGTVAYGDKAHYYFLATAIERGGK